MREHGSLSNIVDFIQAKMKEKADEQEAAIDAQESESEPESEDGGEMIIDSDGEEVPAPKKEKPKKKKKKKVAGGMHIPEYWPWEEAKKLFITPDVAKGEDLEVRYNVVFRF
jgi:flap endonuclease-1